MDIVGGLFLNRRSILWVCLIFSLSVSGTGAAGTASVRHRRSFLSQLHRNFRGLGIVRYPVCKAVAVSRTEDVGSEAMPPIPAPDFSPEYSPEPDYPPPATPADGFNSSTSSTSSIDRAFEWNWLNVLAILLAACCAMLANSAGIGGGPLFMPLFNSVLGFDVDSATALSHTVVSSSSIASSCYGTLQPNPTDQRIPLIDFTLALTFIPPLLIGANLGVVLNTIFPEWTQTSGLFVLLSYISLITYQKATKTWEVESRLKELEASEIRAIRPLSQLSEGEEEEDKESVENNRDGGSLEFEKVGTSDERTEEEEDYGLIDPPSPFKRLRDSAVPLLKLISLWVVFLLFTISMSNTTKCSLQYFILWGGQTIFCAIVTIIMILYVKGGKAKQSLGMQALLLPKEDEVQIETPISKLLRLVLIMLASGTMAGLLGIGGGVIYNPFFLSMGVHPQVTASTSVLMILFSSSAIFISFYLQGLLNLSYASVFAPVCFCSSLLGVALVGKIVRKTKRASIIIFILTFYMVLGALLTLILGGYSALEDFETGTDIGFSQFC